MRHAEWIQNFLVKSDEDMSDGGTIKITPHKAHTRDEAPSNVVGFWNEFLFVAKSTMTNSPDFWSVGHLVTKTLTSSLSWKTERFVEIQSRRTQ